MTDISILGLGPMGFALARALQRKQRRITVWNRTAANADALRADGAIVAPTAGNAVAGAPIVIACVTDYAATYAMLEASDLRGKLLVQLATGTPREARDASAWATARGAAYLDGAILAVPSQIGGPHSTIFVAGAEAAYANAAPLLGELGTLSYAGTQVGAAAALDFAFLSHLFGGLVGFYHGARICEAEGLRVGDLGAMLAAVAPAIGGMVQHDAERIQAEDYASPQSSLETCARGMDLLARHASEAGLDGGVPSFLAAFFARGRAAGLGEQSPAALVKLLRDSATAVSDSTSTHHIPHHE
jgi:3-hydroxyisobutyrate dehydrogenase-like beta-hydroxyacid dehydrogenase